MLKLKDTPELPPVVTRESLEARLDELEFEKLQSETEQLMVSAEGYRNIGTVLNSTGVLSLEAAALAEVAEQLVGGGSSNLSDGLESHVVSGLEAEGKGEGFMAKAKELGAKAMEKIKKMITWIIDKLKGTTYTKVKDLLAKIDKISEELKDADDGHKFEIPELFVKILKDPLPNKVKQFLEIDPFKGAGSFELYNNTETWYEYMKGMENNFRLLTTASNSRFTDGFELDVLPVIHALTVDGTDDYRVWFHRAAKDENRTFKNTTMTVREFKDGISSMQSAINYIESFIKIYTKAYEQFNREISSKMGTESGDYSYLGSHLATLRVITYVIPSEMLDTYNVLLMLKTGTGQSS